MDAEGGRQEDRLTVLAEEMEQFRAQALERTNDLRAYLDNLKT